MLHITNNYVPLSMYIYIYIFYINYAIAITLGGHIDYYWVTAGLLLDEVLDCYEVAV